MRRHVCMHMHISLDTGLRLHVCIKLIAFELAANFLRRRENPVQPRLCNAKNAIFKRLKTGFSLRPRSSPANSNAFSFTHAHRCSYRPSPTCMYTHAYRSSYRSSFSYKMVFRYIHSCIHIHIHKHSVFIFLHVYVYT